MSKPTTRAPEPEPQPEPADPTDDRLDEALEETFPASDPIAVHPEEDEDKARKSAGRTLH